MWDKLYTKHPKNNFLKIMANKKVRSAIYLLLWIIAIFIVYIVFLKPVEDYNKSHPKTNEVIENDDNIQEEITFESMMNKLLIRNYHYVFKLNDDVSYYGDYLDNKSVGYKETTDNIIKYYIDGNDFYEVSQGILSKKDDEEVFSTYFNVDYINDLIKDHNPIITSNIYNFEIDNKYVKITIDDTNISDIELNIDDDIYTMRFSSIGSINTIEY